MKKCPSHVQTKESGEIPIPSNEKFPKLFCLLPVMVIVSLVPPSVIKFSTQEDDTLYTGHQLLGPQQHCQEWCAVGTPERTCEMIKMKTEALIGR